MTLDGAEIEIARDQGSVVCFDSEVSDCIFVEYKSTTDLASFASK